MVTEVMDLALLLKAKAYDPILFTGIPLIVDGITIFVSLPKYFSIVMVPLSILY